MLLLLILSEYADFRDLIIVHVTSASLFSQAQNRQALNRLPSITNYFSCPNQKEDRETLL